MFLTATPDTAVTMMTCETSNHCSPKERERLCSCSQPDLDLTVAKLRNFGCTAACSCALAGLGPRIQRIEIVGF